MTYINYFSNFNRIEIDEIRNKIKNHYINFKYNINANDILLYPDEQFKNLLRELNNKQNLIRN